MQHLYLRFLLDIGDSGTHNILVRKDREKGDRLVAGIDLEEKRKIAEKTGPLGCLFKKPSRRQAILYQSDLGKIESLKYSQINQHIRSKLDAIGIDLDRLKGNIELWESMTMPERRMKVSKKKGRKDQTDMFFRSVPGQVAERITRYRKEKRITLSGFLERAIDALEGMEDRGDMAKLSAAKAKLESVSRKVRLYDDLRKLSDQILKIEKSVTEGDLHRDLLREKRTLEHLQKMRAELVAEIDSIALAEETDEVTASEPISPLDSERHEEDREEAGKKLDEVFGPIPRFTPEELEGEAGDNDLGEVDEKILENTSPPVTEIDVKPDPFLVGDEEDLAEQIQKKIGGGEKEQDHMNNVSESSQDSCPMLIWEDVTPERRKKVEEVKRILKQMAKSGR